MRKRHLLVLVCVLASLAGPRTAEAHHCSSAVSILSGVDPVLVDINGAFCDVWVDPHSYDTRYVLPGATHISLRYGYDWQVSQVTAVVDGMGFDHASFTLTRVPATGIVPAYYGMDAVAIPGGPGPVTATVSFPGGTDTGTYRAIGA